MKTKAIAVLAALALILPLSGCSFLTRREASGLGNSAASQPNSGDVSNVSQVSLYDRGLELIAQMREMAGSPEYLSLYTDAADVRAIAIPARAGKNAQPSAVYQITFPGDSALAFYQLEGEGDNLPQRLRDSLREQYCSAAVFANSHNAAYGAATIAAFSICTASEVFVYPGLQENALYLYQYADAVSAVVSFVKGEDGTVSAAGMFLFSEDGDFSALKEEMTEAGVQWEQLES